MILPQTHEERADPATTDNSGELRSPPCLSSNVSRTRSMISLAALLTAVALAAVFIAVVWRLGRTAAGACLALGIILLLGSVSSCSYGMHFYMGDSAWPSYLFQ